METKNIYKEEEKPITGLDLKKWVNGLTDEELQCRVTVCIGKEVFDPGHTMLCNKKIETLIAINETKENVIMIGPFNSRNHQNYQKTTDPQ